MVEELEKLSEDLSIRAEEDMLHSQLENISNLSYMAWFADPKTGKIDTERTKKIILSAQTAVGNIKNHLNKVKYFIEVQLRQKPLSVEDRIKEIELTKSLDIMNIDPKTITWHNQPTAGYMIGEVHPIEILVDNLFITAHLYNQFQKCKTPEECSNLSEQYLNIFSDIIRNHELTRYEVREKLKELKKSNEKEAKQKIKILKKKIRCPPDNTSSGRAKFSYAYELLDAKRRGVPNVLERIQQGEDYSIIYGREGIHYEHKARGIIPYKYKFVDAHERASRRKNGFSFAMPIRALYVDVIPEYKELLPPPPGMHG